MPTHGNMNHPVRCSAGFTERRCRRRRWMLCWMAALAIISMIGFDIRQRGRLIATTTTSSDSDDRTRHPREADPFNAIADTALPDTVSEYNGPASNRGPGSGSRDRSNDGCLHLNSEEWLTGPRYQNAIGDHEDLRLQAALQWLGGRRNGADTSTDSLFPRGMATVLDQTICPATSYIRSFVETPSNIPYPPGNRTSAGDRSPVPESILLWKARLIYMAIFLHQHRHAIPEAVARAGSRAAGESDDNNPKIQRCIDQLQRYGINTFDYECPSANLLVAELPSNAGLGSLMRIDAVNALMVGLAANRTVLFVNNIQFNQASDADRTGIHYNGQTDVPGNATGRSHPSVSTFPNAKNYPAWKLASCSRHDFQCLFQPLTPCAPTRQELAEAPVVTSRTLSRFLSSRPVDENRRGGILNNVEGVPESQQSFADRRVVRLQLDRKTLQVFEGVPESLHKTAIEFVDEYLPGASSQVQGDISSNHRLRYILHRAADSILQDQADREGYDYLGSESTIKHVALLYILRPRSSVLDLLNKLVEKDLNGDQEASMAVTQPMQSTSSSFTATPILSTVGLPIRASDKCRSESECLSFPNTMKVVAQVWNRSTLTSPQRFENNAAASSIGRDVVVVTLQRQRKPRLNILLTSESPVVIKNKDRFLLDTTLMDALPFQPHFVTNGIDVRQGTGAISSTIRKQLPFDRVLLSALSSIRLQLHAEVTVGNCCSNFHNVLFDLLRAGCGVAAGSPVANGRWLGQAIRNRGECLQKNPNPEFQLCCRYDPECMKRRDAELAAYLNVSKVRLSDLQRW